MINFFLIVLISVFLSISPLKARYIYPKTVAEFVEMYPETKWTRCTQNYAFDRAVFPLFLEYNKTCFPSQGYHNDISVIEVPNGVANVISDWRHIFINDVFVQETMIKNIDPFRGHSYIEKNDLETVMQVTGRVVVINHVCPYIYGHWVFDILGQLALLELFNIEYDYLWIPYDMKFMKETLEIWGIDSAKIIPMSLDTAMKADTIILPTSVGQNDVLIQWHVNYYPDFLLRYIRDKMLNGIKKMDITSDFSEKIFISRKNVSRSVPNEDEIFALFEPFGFQRYELTELSVQEQIILFSKAKTIISFVGSGSTNIMFCRPGTHYIEITQSVVDATFFFISDIFNLKYSWISGTTYNDLFYGGPFSLGRHLPLHIIENYIKACYLEL